MDNAADREFEFVEKASPIPYVVVDSSILTEQALMELFERCLSFPDYFGRNWDALRDLLCAPYWIDAPEVVVVHPSLPQLSHEELKLYLRILLDARESRTPEETPRFRVIFAKDDHETVTALLRDFVSIKGM